MNELIPTIQNRDIPEDWDYSESVKKEKQIMWKWKNVTIESIREKLESNSEIPSLARLTTKEGKSFPRSIEKLKKV